MSQSVFDFENYKVYLSEVLSTTGSARGLRSQLAKTLNCQTAFISQVLRGNTHFSLEHAVMIGNFLRLDEEESNYFMLLVHYGRAGSKKLRNYYLRQMKQIQNKRQFIRERLHVKKVGISERDQAKYYSSWYYAAIHILLSIRGFQTKKAVADYFKIPISFAWECLEFLVSIGLVIRAGEKYEIGSTRIHLDACSPLISKHHTNWRMKAIDSLSIPNKNNLHYSSVISVSQEDAVKIRTILLDSLERMEQVLRSSNEEALLGLAIDLFEV